MSLRTDHELAETTDPHTTLSRRVARFAGPMAAVKDNHKPGAAGLPVIWIKYVQMAGVKPPKSAAARLYARENPAVFASAGIISVR